MGKKTASARSHAARPAAAGDERRGHGETTEANPSAGGTNNNIVASRSRPKMTQEEKMASLRFIKAAHEDALRYIAMTEEEVEEEYRLAGKLHKYDPDTEWMKRVARVARIYPPPKVTVPDLDEYMRILEEDEQDFPIGLASCAGIFL